MIKEPYVKPTICAKCKGECCKGIPGAVHPDDLGDDLKDKLVRMFVSGKYVVNYREDDDGLRDYFVRPRGVDTTDSLLFFVHGEKCVFLTDSGCEIAPAARPRECRMLEPKSAGGCISHVKGVTARWEWWKPHEKALLEAVNEASLVTQ